jgi:hypothetical protein
LSTSPAFHEALLVGTRGVIRLTEYATGKPFGFGYHLELNGGRILSGDQVPSNYTLQLQEFVSALRENRRPIASGEEILRPSPGCRPAIRERKKAHFSFSLINADEKDKLNHPEDRSPLRSSSVFPISISQEEMP